jgi:hypothetical protein
VIAVRPRVVDTVTRSELTENEVVVSLRGGERALIVNAIADAILDLCDGSRTVDEIAAFLRDNLSVPTGADVVADVRAVIDELARAGVVVAAE